MTAALILMPPRRDERPADVSGIVAAIEAALNREGYELLCSYVLGPSPSNFLLDLLAIADQIVLYDVASGELSLASGKYVLSCLLEA